MADTRTLTLVCLVEGTSNIYKVPTTQHMNVLDVRNLIMEMAKRTLNDVDVADLIFWKVDIPPPPIHQWKDLIGKSLQNAEELGPFDIISDRVFTLSTISLNFTDHVSIVLNSTIFALVPFPPPPTTVPTSVTLSSIPSASELKLKVDDLAWLREVYSHIWNRKHLRSQIFRTVKFTRQIFNELQVLLGMRCPDRDRPEYSGNNPNVKGVKLKFLSSLPLLSPHSDHNDLVDDGGTVNVENAELESLFPTTLTFLDLSSLNLTEKVSNRLPLPLLFREEYNIISGLIESRPRNNGGSVIVSGQPGVGKTAYIFLRMIEKMIEGHPFLFQNKSRVVYYVSEEGIEAVGSLWSPKEPIMAFVDGDKTDNSPGPMLDDTHIQLVVASSPKGASEKWIRQLGDGSRVSQIATKLWSREELLLTGIFLKKYDLRFDLLMKATAHFGFNPRQCFRISSTLELEETKSEIASLLDEKWGVASDMIDVIKGARTGNLQVSHRFFQISPDPSDPQQLLARCEVDCVSSWAWDLLLERYDIHTADQKAAFYDTITATRLAGSLRSRMGT